MKIHSGGMRENIERRDREERAVVGVNKSSDSMYLWAVLRRQWRKRQGKDGRRYIDYSSE